MYLAATREYFIQGSLTSAMSEVLMGTLVTPSSRRIRGAMGYTKIGAARYLDSEWGGGVMQQIGGVFHWNLMMFS